MTASSSILAGLVPVNKPCGITSKDVSRALTRHFGPLKLGHVGTLDPGADGVLPVLVGRATLLQDYLLKMPKAYSFEFKLGTATDTLDATGNKVCELPWEHVTIETVQKTISTFIGRIMQTPPLYSAVKYQGKELYKYARAGEQLSDLPLESLARPVEIMGIQIDSCKLPFIGLSVKCSKGTYVRTLALDIAQAMGTTAHVTKLTRTQSAGFELKGCISIEQATSPGAKLQDFLVPFDQLAIGLPTWCPDDMVLLRRLINGQHVLIEAHKWPIVGLDVGQDVLVKTNAGLSMGIVNGALTPNGLLKLHLKRGFQCLPA